MEHPLIIVDLHATLHMNRSDVRPTLTQETPYSSLATIIICITIIHDTAANIHSTLYTNIIVMYVYWYRQCIHL